MFLKSFLKARCREWLFIVLALACISLAYETNSPWMSPNKFLRNTYIDNVDTIISNNGEIASMQNVKIKMPNSKIITTINVRENACYERIDSSKQTLYQFNVILEQLESSNEDPIYFPRNFVIGKKIPISYIIIDADVQAPKISKEKLKEIQAILKSFQNEKITKIKFRAINVALDGFGIDSNQKSFMLLKFLGVPIKVVARPHSYSYIVGMHNKFGEALMIHIKTEVVSIRPVEPE